MDSGLQHNVKKISKADQPESKLSNFDATEEKLTPLKKADKH